MSQDYIEFQTVTGPRGGLSKVWQAIAAGEIVGNYRRKIDAETALDAAIEIRRTFEGFVASVDYDRQDWQYADITKDGKQVLHVSAPRMFGEFKTWTVTDAASGCVYDSRVKPSLATLARLARAYVETMREGAAYRVANEVTTPDQEEWLQPVDSGLDAESADLLAIKNAQVRVTLSNALHILHLAISGRLSANATQSFYLPTISALRQIKIDCATDAASQIEHALNPARKTAFDKSQARVTLRELQEVLK
jgi:hypothetical protein